MTVNFADGIELVIDEDKLISWQQSNDKRFVMLAVKEESGHANYEIDLKEKEIRHYYDDNSAE